MDRSPSGPWPAIRRRGPAGSTIRDGEPQLAKYIRRLVAATRPYSAETGWYDRSPSGLVEKCVELGVWLRPFKDVIYLMPPLTIREEELKKLTDSIKSLLAT